MKPIKLLLAVSLFLISNYSNAQVVDKAKFLFFQFAMQEYPNVYSDSVIITKNSGDTLWFNTINSPTATSKTSYYHTDLKIYKITKTKNILYYDYNLSVNDTFFSEIGNGKDTFILDSIYYTTLAGNQYKSWHLTSTKKRNSIKFNWIEGLGDIKLGWDTKSFFMVDGGWRTIGICVNSNLLYWNNPVNYFKTRNPIANCAFDSLQRILKNKESIKNSFTVYPNPTKGNINIILQSPQTGQVVAYNAIGQIIYNKSFENLVNLNFELPNTIKGLIYIKVQTANYSTTKVVLVE